MTNWEIFENECVNFLNSNFGNNDIKFIGKGKSDSTTSDIEVMVNNRVKFLIESKMPKAQSGQFVLLIEGDKFIYSPENKTPENEYAHLIKDYINNNFNLYKDVSTRALEIDLPISYFTEWIKNHYIKKGVRFVITYYKNEFVIFPIEKYGDYFNVTANFRRKKSGSSELPQKYFNDVKEYFENKHPNPFYLTQKGKKIFLQSDAQLNKYQFSITDINCQLTFKEDEGMYEIRKLGSTNNPNVIFSVECIKPQDNRDLILFINSLK
ncbi:hypothetical protein [Caproiciproducens sp. MSJ-32]|uniref:hypothetical protein n=1 Tax=Caproiciproducens sp. MSJ-32 TaxID=2841527 RepID=UPI001C107E36|nr:hypothetical protein [Caproiciproducens sp. MSJ-32]MBU5455293.1 hypothetical protein [Caproiciproducens sp. MSJ-32]